MRKPCTKAINCFKRRQSSWKTTEKLMKSRDWQRINLKNIQAAPAAQFQKNKLHNQKMCQRTKQTFLQGTYRWLTNTWKDAQHHSLSEKCKSKPLWGTISHQSEWLLYKSLQTINAGEGVEKREPSYTVGGNANYYSHRTLWRFLKKLEIKLLGIHIEETRLKETHVPQCSSQHCL